MESIPATTIVDETTTPPVIESNESQPTTTPSMTSTTTVSTESEPITDSVMPEVPPPTVLGGVATLDLELANLVSGFGSFWGKVKSSSVSAYQTSSKQIDQLATTARQDLTPLIAKTRAGIDHYSETAKAELNRLNEMSKLDVNESVDNGMFVGADGNVVFINSVTKDETKKDLKGKGVDRSEHEGGEEDNESNEPTPAAQASAFFSKLQSQVSSNPNFEKLSKNLTTLQHSVSNNLSTLPTSLTSNINNLSTQLLTLEQKLANVDLNATTQMAEEYVLKGEGWIAEMAMEVQRLAKEAVTVLPPGELDGKNKRKEQRMKEAEQVAVGRKEGLLMRLRSDASSILLVDPAQPPPSSLVTESNAPVDLSASISAASTPSDTRESYSKFLQALEQSGGMEGEIFNNRIANELKLTIGNAGENLKLAVKGLVGEGKMTEETFWCRYFFRVGQIEEDEVRRRRVLEVAAGEEEDFSWDADEEEEEEAATAAASLPSTSTAPTATVEESESTTSTPARRESSEATHSTEASYDLVGIKSGEGSEAGDPSSPVVKEEIVEKKKEVVEKKEEEKKAEDSGEDSDWE